MEEINKSKYKPRCTANCKPPCDQRGRHSTQYGLFCDEHFKEYADEYKWNKLRNGIWG